MSDHLESLERLAAEIKKLDRLLNHPPDSPPRAASLTGGLKIGALVVLSVAALTFSSYALGQLRTKAEWQPRVDFWHDDAQDLHRKLQACRDAPGPKSCCAQPWQSLDLVIGDVTETIYVRCDAKENQVLIWPAPALDGGQAEKRQ